MRLNINPKITSVNIMLIRYTDKSKKIKHFFIDFDLIRFESYERYTSLISTNVCHAVKRNNIYNILTGISLLCYLNYCSNLYSLFKR